MMTEVVFIPEYGTEYQIPASWSFLIECWCTEVHPTEVFFESDHPAGQAREWFECRCEDLCQDMDNVVFDETDKSTCVKPNIITFYDNYTEENYVFNCSHHGQKELLMDLCYQAKEVGSDFDSFTSFYFEV